MFRTFLSSLASRSVQQSSLQCVKNYPQVFHYVKNPALSQFAKFHSLDHRREIKICSSSIHTPHNFSYNFLKPVPSSPEQKRTVTKASWKKGKRGSVKAVIDRFYRLNCGNWIRTIAGRTRKLWKKSGNRRRRNLQHVFCNATQCKLLDKMVSNYWKKPKYFIKSPYEPYEWRNEFHITRKKHWRPEGCDYE